MANTYTIIASNTLSSSAASVTFSSIPATYTDLVLRISARANGSGLLAGLAIKFNGSTTSIYSNTNLFAYSSSGTSNRSSSVASIPAMDNITDGGATANSFSSNELYIPSYTISQNKPSSLFSVVENKSATNFEWLVYTGAGLYRDTAAISSIALTTNAGSFVSGSSFFLYGIKNS
jgi:hypothetical protein